MISSSIVGPIIGALISGIIGLSVVEYQNRREEVSNLEQWYDHTIRLADQIERETPDSYLSSFRGEGPPRESSDRKEEMIAAYERIGSRLRDHNNNAPVDIEESAVELATETARYCLMTASDNRGHNVLEYSESAVKSAESLRSEAKEAKNQLGWL